MKNERETLTYDSIIGKNGALDAYSAILNLCDKGLVPDELQMEILDLMANYSLSTQEKTRHLNVIIRELTVETKTSPQTS